MQILEWFRIEKYFNTCKLVPVSIAMVPVKLYYIFKLCSLHINQRKQLIFKFTLTTTNLEVSHQKLLLYVLIKRFKKKYKSHTNTKMIMEKQFETVDHDCCQLRSPSRSFRKARSTAMEPMIEKAEEPLTSIKLEWNQP